MGLEAACTVRVARKSHRGKALLESQHLVFRGDISLKVPFDRMREVTTDRDHLVVRTNEQELRFDLGASTAERWSRLIKEPKGLFEKLEIDPRARTAVVDVRDPFFLTALRERVPGVTEGMPEGASVIFFGADTREALRKIPLLRARMIDSGFLWVIRPKGSKALAESEVLSAIRDAGLIDTKVVAFSSTHTAHKAVIPLRGRPTRRRPPIVSVPPETPTGHLAPSTRRPGEAPAQKKRRSTIKGR